MFRSGKKSILQDMENEEKENSIGSQIRRDDIFREYLDYKIAGLRSRVDSAVTRSLGLSPKQLRGYRKTEKYSSEFARVMSMEKKRYLYWNAVGNPEIVAAYLKLEPMAIAVREYGLRPKFGNLQKQYFKVRDRIKAREIILPRMNEIMELVRVSIEGKLEGRRITFQRYAHYTQEISEDNFQDFILFLRKDPFGFITRLIQTGQGSVEYSRKIARSVLDPEEIFPELPRKEAESAVFRTLMDMHGDIAAKTAAYFTMDRIIRCIFRNSRYKALKEAFEEQERVYSNIVKAIPDRLENLFPATRQMKRHFVLHIGPTNSGKTHDAMAAMRKKGDGVYLAPLRLLAYEQYERMNEDGYPCSMITGEEIIRQDRASFTASTIEMCDFERYYACAVIDEAQMISDTFRGGSWTNAVFGVMAEEVHVCAAPEAEKILVRIVEMCGDTYEIRYHERKTRLEYDPVRFNLRKSVRPHDACIVFSRKQVHYTAAELQRRGFRVSIIYGNLPYDVRHEEARKFAEGENDVLVSTDAIGMGMNLPIRRIVFLETQKYDGIERRPLKDTEIKQIAGRAGRYGVFDTGYFASAENGPEIRGGFEALTPDIEKLYVSFPRSLLGIDGKLSTTIEQWQNIRIAEGMELESTEEMLELAKEAETMTDNKEMIYELATIPFDYKKGELKQIWRTLAGSVALGRDPQYGAWLSSLNNRAENADEDIRELESCSEECDLLYNFDRKFNGGKLNEEIRAVRTEVSRRIMQILSMQKLEGKTCKYCGRPLPWNYEYSMCGTCFGKGAFNARIKYR